MLRSYLTVALRGLAAHKLHAGINLGGLAVGLACSLLMLVFVRHEIGFDARWPNADRIFRISADYAPGNGRAGLYPAPNVEPAAPALAADFPGEIERAARLGAARVRLKSGQSVYWESGFRWADAGFFDLFPPDWLRGTPARALAEPSSAVLTASAALKYFGTLDAVGRTLTLENQWPLSVTGVIRDFGDDTHLSGTVIASFDVGEKVLAWDYGNNWSYWGFHTYARLRAGASIATVERGLPAFIARHKRAGDGISGMTATPLRAVHLHGRLAELTPPGSVATVATFAAVALCILLIACVNFTNLSTARATERAREVGVRKSLGADRGRLIAQFIGEAVLYAVAAMVLAIALVEVTLPKFAALLGTRLELRYAADWPLFAALAAIAPLVGVLAGAYPAFYLSAFQPSRVLKGDLTRGAAGARLRGVLVVLQFAISIVLAIVTAVIYQQTRFASRLERGFDTSQIVVLSGSPTEGLGRRWNALAEHLRSYPEIERVIGGSMRPSGAGGERSVRAEGGDPGGRQMPTKGVDFGFFEAYGIEVLAGRTFDERHGTDRFLIPSRAEPHTTGAFVLNELAARELGWTPEQALGKWFEVDYSFDYSITVRGPVIGVVRNTYAGSLREPLRPLAYFASAETYAYGTTPFFQDASIRVSGKHLAETLAFIDAAWQEYEPDQPLSRRFLDDEFQALYDNERRAAAMFGAFSAGAIAIACLGLFGLAAFATEQRAKEIGIRKVLGGTVFDVLVLVTGQFGKLVAIANVVAWPIAWLAMHRWLEGFAYRIDLTLGVFVAAAAATFAVASLTVAAIAARAAAAQPIRALRQD